MSEISFNTEWEDVKKLNTILSNQNIGENAMENCFIKRK